MNGRRHTIVEACVDSFESAVIAEACGVDRVELCANLVEGGTTPSHGSIVQAVERLSIPCFVMIRTRGGDFCYSEDEVDIMMRDIAAVKAAGAAGIVFGALRPDGTIDRDALSTVISAARPLSVTFHRAFDMTRSPSESLNTLMTAGVDRLLTSGQRPSVLDATDLVRLLIRQAGDTLVVMPGGGITAANVRPLIDATGAKEVHVYTERTLDSPMAFRNPAVHMGRPYEPNEYIRPTADPTAFSQVVAATRQLS